MTLRGSKQKARGGEPQTLGEILSSFLKRRGLFQEMQDRQVITNWDDLVGPMIAREAKQIKIERGILWIGGNNAPQANHFLYLMYGSILWQV